MAPRIKALEAGRKASIPPRSNSSFSMIQVPYQEQDKPQVDHVEVSDNKLIPQAGFIVVSFIPSAAIADK